MSISPFDVFLHKDPPLFNHTESSLVKEPHFLVNATKSTWDGILARETPQDAVFDNCIRPVVEQDNRRSERENVLRFYASTSPSKALRDASNTAIKLFNESDNDIFSRPELFEFVERVMQKLRSGSLAMLDAQSKRYVLKLHQRFLVHGCGIVDQSQRITFVDKQKRLNDLARQYRQNMANEKSGLWLTRDELHGVPESLLDRLAQGTTEQADKLGLPTKVFYAVVNRMPHNVSLFRELALLRDQTARMLGWQHHLAFKTAQKMMQSSEVVKNLLAETRTALSPVAEQYAADLLRLKREEAKGRGEGADNLKLFLWDRQYFQHQLDEQYRKSSIPVFEYFELDTTLQKLLDIYEHLLGVKLVSIDTADSDQKLVWHEDVQMFSAWDTDSKRPAFLAYVYLDLFPREGKWTHVGQYTLQRRYQRPDGTWFDPCSCLIMNFLKPTPESPNLLILDDVRKLFHELGHMYHCILSRAKYAALHSVDSDFIEFPSMMLEQFLWDAKIIRDISYHYSCISPEMDKAWQSTTTGSCAQPPCQLSLEQAAELAETVKRNDILSQLNNLFFATYDMLIHSPASHSVLEEMNLSELFNKTRADILHMDVGYEGWGFGQGQSVFRAIQGKYDAGYYAYILGRVFALNISQTGFSKDPLNKENGQRYRDMVLCKDSSQPEMKTLADYLGHDPSMRPYLEWLGIEGMVNLM